MHVFCPSYAVFPQYLDASYSFASYWNYLRRQLVVLDTFANDHNRKTNHVMALLHCYFSWSFVIPCLIVVARLLVHGTLVGLSLLLWTNNDTTVAVAVADVSSQNGCSPHAYAYTIFCSMVLYAMGALFWMTGIVCSVLEAQDPSSLPPHHLRSRFHWGTLWVGFILGNAIVPVCMAYTFATNHIVWSGVRYRRKQGKVVHVQHV